MEVVQTIVSIIGAAFGLLVLLAVGWFAWKRALLSVQEKALEVQSQSIEAYKTRIEQLEEAAKRDSDERSELREQIAELRGQLQERHDLALAIIEAVGESRVCLAAPDCVNRVVPSL